MKFVAQSWFLKCLSVTFAVVATSAIVGLLEASAYAQLSSLHLAQADLGSENSVRRDVGGSSPTGRRRGGGTFVQRKLSGPPPTGRPWGGGSRNLNGQDVVCPKTKLPLTALVPFEEIYEPGFEELPPITRVWGFTTAEHPVVWVYVPYANSNIPATLSLEEDKEIKDEETVEPVKVSVTLPKQAGVVGIPLPATHPGLTVGKRYRWLLRLDCKPSSTETSDDVYIQAVIIRDQLPADVARQLTPNPSLENASLYAQNGFWHDALTTLAELYRQQPENSAIQTAWRGLISDMLLSEESKQTSSIKEISTAPIVK